MTETTESWPTLGPFIARQPAPLAGSGRLSGIAKQPATEALWLGVAGLEGDRVMERRWHGGEARALCIYPGQHYRHWQRAFPRGRFAPGSLGENLCCEGLDEQTACIGDRLRWGEALLEISQPRTPCRSLDQHLRSPGLGRSMAQEARTGWLCRVLEEGWVTADAPLLRLDCRYPQASVAALWHARNDPAVDERQLRAFIDLPPLARHYRGELRERLDLRRRQQDQGSLF